MNENTKEALRKAPLYEIFNELEKRKEVDSRWVMNGKLEMPDRTCQEGAVCYFFYPWSNAESTRE